MGAFQRDTTNGLGAGIGLKPQHYQEVLDTAVDNNASNSLWFEVHTENYFVDGGPRLQYLDAISDHYPLSFHGVGASLGGLERPGATHLKKVKQLIDRYSPSLVSEHAVWSTAGSQYFADLLPLPRTKEALVQLIDGIDHYQCGIGRTILIENPTNYLPFKSERDEPDFLVEAAVRTGCGLLLDVNNLYLSSRNCGMNAEQYINSIPEALVGEIHIAGFDTDAQFGEELLIDSHAREVSEPVWDLLQHAINRFGAVPVLLERDGNIPEFGELLLEQQRAQAMLRDTPVHKPVLTAILKTEQA